MSAAATDTSERLPSLEIPAIRDLADLRRRWVCWQYQARDGKATKVPLRPDGSNASSTAPGTWSLFEDCYAAAVRGVGDGLGVVLNGDGLVGVDLDHVVDADGRVDPAAQTIVEMLDSYTEVSPSGRGLRVFLRGELPPGRRKRGNIEMYDRARYLTVTGLHLAGTPETIGERAQALSRVHAAWLGAGRVTRWSQSDHLGDSTGDPAPRVAPGTWDGLLPWRVEIVRGMDPTVALLLQKPHNKLGYASPSEADYALACTLAENVHTLREIEAALRWRHRNVEPRPKSLDYFARTAANALAAVAAKGSR